MMKQRYYLRSKASKTGSKYLRQAFQHLCNKVDYTLRVLSRIFCLGGKSILKKIFEPRGGEKTFFRPSREGPGACSPGQF